MCVCVCVCVCMYLDALQHARVKDVHASVDLVGDENLGLLHEALDPPALRLKHHHAILRGLFHPGHLGTHTHTHTLQSGNPLIYAN